MMRIVSMLLRKLGRAFQYLGGGLLFLSAVVGTLIADVGIFLLFFISFGQFGRGKFLFCTRLISELVLGDHRDAMHNVANGYAVLALMLSSGIMTSVVVILSLLFLGPHLALFAGAIWVVSSVLLVLGFGIEKIGERLASASLGREGVFTDLASSTPMSPILGQPSSLQVRAKQSNDGMVEALFPRRVFCQEDRSDAKETFHAQQQRRTI